MPNQNYVRGVRKERKIVNEARKNNLISFRSAGSHSPIDVIIIDEENSMIRLIQCKPDDFSENERKLLLNKYKKLNKLMAISFEVI